MYKLIRIPESGKVCLYIRNPILGFGIHNQLTKPERLECGTQVPLAKNRESSTSIPESTVWNPESEHLLDHLTLGDLSNLVQKVTALSNYFRQLPLGESERPCSKWLFYPTSRGFSVSWLLGFTKSFTWLFCLVLGLFTPREKREVNKPNMRQTSHANDFVNPKSHATEKSLLAGYGY